MARLNAKRRSGATTVEAAIILPVALFLLIALGIGAMGVFNYQECATLAREGSRYASCHGAQWRKDAGLPMGTTTDWTNDIVNNGIMPKRMNLDPSRMNVTVNWAFNVINQPGIADNWPGSNVTVKVSYTWIPATYLTGSYTLTSTSQLPITN